MGNAKGGSLSSCETFWFHLCSVCKAVKVETMPGRRSRRITEDRCQNCLLRNVDYSVSSATSEAAKLKLCQQQLNREMFPCCEGFVRKKSSRHKGLRIFSIGRIVFLCDLPVRLHVLPVQLRERKKERDN